MTCIFPFCFLFFKNYTRCIKYAAIVAAGLIAIAVIFSGSRAGVLAIVSVTAVWLFIQLKNQKIRLKISLFKILLVAIIFTLLVVLYLFKKDSADGRLLIWRCAIDMIADKPVFGHGVGAFNAKYMLYQAAYFNANLDSRYAQLADNTQYPFNEYLLILCEYGVAGLCVVILMVILLARAYRRNNSKENLPALMSLFALAVFSFFSYPFKYPFTWLILFLNITIICFPIINNSLIKIRGKLPNLHSKIYNWFFRVAIFLLSIGLLTYTILLTQAEMKWRRITHSSLLGKTAQILPKYDDLYCYLGKDGLFLYNHAAELHKAKEFERSITVFERCLMYYNDMDVQMLLADNYIEIGKYAKAEHHLKMATLMCPSRFMPLYKLVKLYQLTERGNEAFTLAKKIIDKDVKIHSSTVTAILNEMRQLVETQKYNKH